MRGFGALAERALKAGQSVVVDAVHAKEDERDALAAVASALGVPFAGLLARSAGGDFDRAGRRRGRMMCRMPTPPSSKRKSASIKARCAGMLLDARRPLDKLQSAALSAITPAAE